MMRSRFASNGRGRLSTIMRLTGKTPWLFAAALGAAVACGGVSDRNFYDGPAKRVTQSGGTGVGASASVGGGAGHAPSTGGANSSGGTGATGGGSTGGGGDTTVGGSGGSGNEAAIGGSGNAAATGGSGDAPAAGGTTPATGGTTGGDAGAGDAPSGGTGGDVSPGGMGGTTPMAGMGGTAGQTGGSGNVGGAGMSGAGMGGNGGNATGGRGGRGGAGNDCQMKLMQLDDKLTAAQVCNRAQDSSCLGFVQNECGCDVPVNNPKSAAAKAYLAAIEDAAGCFACTEALCPTATGAYCQGSGAALEGLCVSSQFSTF